MHCRRNLVPSRSPVTRARGMRSVVAWVLGIAVLSTGSGPAAAREGPVTDPRVLSRLVAVAVVRRGAIRCRFKTSTWTNPEDMAAKGILDSSAATDDGSLVPLREGLWESDGIARMCSLSSKKNDDFDQRFMTDGSTSIVVDGSKLRAAVVSSDILREMFLPGSFLLSIEGSPLDELVASARDVVPDGVGILRATASVGSSTIQIWIAETQGYQVVKALKLSSSNDLQIQISVQYEQHEGNWFPVKADRAASTILHGTRQIVGKHRTIMTDWAQADTGVRLAMPAGFAILDTVSEQTLPIAEDLGQLMELHSRMLRWSTELSPDDPDGYMSRPWRDSGWPTELFTSQTLNSKLFALQQAGREMRDQYVGEGLCGEMCVLLILRFLDIDRTLDELRTAHSPLRGMSLREMQSAVRQAGVAAEWARMSADEALQLTQPFVMIPATASKGGEEHFVVCRNSPGGTVVVVDFPFPPKRLRESWLRKHWQGMALLVDEDTKKTGNSSAGWPLWRIVTIAFLGCLLAGSAVRLRRRRRVS